MYYYYVKATIYAGYDEISFCTEVALNREIKSFADLREVRDILANRFCKKYPKYSFIVDRDTCIIDFYSFLRKE